MKVILTEPAVKDLKNIASYFTEKVSRKIALQIVKHIRDHYMRLPKQPYMGQEEPLLIYRKQGFRYLVEGNYKIIYRVDEAENKVYVSRIFDCRQEPEKLKK